MRIGIITIFHVPNYGAMLQCYSLCSYLTSKGHEIVLFDQSLSNTNRLAYRIKRFLKLKFMEDFIERNLPHTTKDFTLDCDLYLVGSDQVWNPEIVRCHLDTFLLSFAPTHAIKASYAASIGLSDWNFDNLTERVTTLLRNFKYVTVREKSAVSLLQSKFGIKSHQVLDPCFLLSLNKLKALLPSNTTEISRKLTTFKLVYSYKWYKSSKNLAKEMNANWTELNARYIKSQDELRGFNIKHVTVSQWLYHIASSEYFITDSFHGCVFALLFQRQFVVVRGLQHRVTRLQSLLESLHLEHRMVDSITDAKELFTQDHIDYNIVNSHITPLISESKKHLENILNCQANEYTLS